MAQPNGPQAEGPAPGLSHPSLMGGDAGARSSSQTPLSVLAALGSNAPPPSARISDRTSNKSSKRLLWTLGALVAMALGLSWTLHEAAPSVSPNTPPPVAAVAMATPASVTAMAAPAIAPTPSAPPVAAIEDLPEAATAPAVAASAVVETVTPPPRTDTADRKHSKAVREKGRAHSNDKTTDKTKRHAKAKPSSPTTATVQPSDDADVDLIAAIVQHMNRGSSRADPVEISDHVARCKSLPAADRQRCVRRICENYWGRADACPRSAASNEAGVTP